MKIIKSKNPKLTQDFLIKHNANENSIAYYAKCNYINMDIADVIRDAIKHKEYAYESQKYQFISWLLHCAWKDNPEINLSKLIKGQRIKELHFGYAPFKNINFIGKCKHLQYLNLCQCSLTDISPLAANSKLTDLLLTNNNLTNIDVIEKLNKLCVLSLHGNNIESLAFISNLQALRILHVDAQLIPQLKYAKKCPLLEKVFIHDKIEDEAKKALKTQFKYVYST